MEKEILEKMPEWFHILRNALLEDERGEKYDNRLDKV
jgi:hypothetical protein